MSLKLPTASINMEYELPKMLPILLADNLAVDRKASDAVAEGLWNFCSCFTPTDCIYVAWLCRRSVGVAKLRSGHQWPPADHPTLLL